MEFPEPTALSGDRGEVLLRYLDWFRSVAADKLSGLEDEEVRQSVVPSGWTPLELVHHLVHVEIRWLDWGFEGRETPDPWGDEVDGRWHVPAELDRAEVLVLLEERGRRTREVVLAHELDEVGAPGERWRGDPPATLERVLLHLVQEYARHIGHLDIARELIDGRVGE